MTWPNRESDTSRTGTSHWAWFHALNDSNRNWKLICSLILKFLNSPVSQLVDEAAHQTVVHTDRRTPAITPHIMVVQKSLPAGDIVANAGGSGFVVDTLGPGIDRREDHAVGAMLDLGIKRIVAGVPGPIA